jgi:hypothetical protein
LLLRKLWRWLHLNKLRKEKLVMNKQQQVL